MRWTPGRRSSNLEDRRGAGGMMGGGMRLGLGGTVVLLVLSLIFGRDFIGGADDGTVTSPAGGGLAPTDSAREEPLVQFVGAVLDSTQVTWAQLLPRYGVQYRDAKLVLFRNATRTGCGVGQTAMGPFYCPMDERVYLDLGFMEDLRSRFGAPGDFAQAYVIAHELGHHVQHLLGIDERVRRAQEGDPRSANALSVRLELQADCFAGVWGHSAAGRGTLDPGDVDEGLNAAAAVGDDRIQRQTTGRVNVDAFTHGSSEQRASWFRRGFSSGDPKACDTFADVGR